MASTWQVLNDQANGARLSRLLVNKGTEALRAVLDTHVRHLPSTLAAVLNTNKPVLQKLRYKVINTSQWKLLYPSSGTPDSKTFDVTLLTVLLRNICGLATPASGWDALPPDSDNSIAANIARIKYYRYHFHAHITTTEITDNEFENLWLKISKALISLGIPKSDLDQLKQAPLGPEEADCIDRATDDLPADSSNPATEDKDEEYKRAYVEALKDGKAKNNRIPIMLIGQDRGGKTSLMRHLLGLPFNKDQPSTNGIDVNVIELTEQNAKEPWRAREVKEFMTSEGEAENAILEKATEYFDSRLQRKLEVDAPEPSKLAMHEAEGMPVIAEKPVAKSLSTKSVPTEVISKMKTHTFTAQNQEEVLRVFLADFAGQKIYYDTHGCFVKPHCAYVLVHDLSLKFDEPAVPKFKVSEKEKEEEMNNPHGTTNLDNLTSWLKFLQDLGKFQDKDIDKSGPYSVNGREFHLPPVLIALTHCDEAKDDDSVQDVKSRIQTVLGKGTYKNVFPECFLINNTLEGDKEDDIRKLRKQLFDLSNIVLKKEPAMPLNWLRFEAALSKLSSLGKYIPVDEAKKVAENCDIKKFDEAIKFLHRLGAVVYHSGSSQVVLDPPWLMNLFTEVISIPKLEKVDPMYLHDYEVFKKKGILFQEYLKKKAPLKDVELLEELMKKFNLISPCQHEERPAFYVPSLAPLMMVGKELEESTIPSLFVTFPNQFVPMGLFTKLQVKLISKYKESFPHGDDPSFYCNYSLLPYSINGDVYDVRLIGLQEFIKVTVLPYKLDGNHSKFASHFLAILKECLNDLKSPDQLLFSMTSYDLEVKCTCCFGEEERCFRHDKTQCDSDRCGHFWKLSKLQGFYNRRSFVPCLWSKRLPKGFYIEKEKIWLDTVSDAPMELEISSQFGLPDEKSSETSSSECDNSMSDTLNKRLHISMDDTSEKLPKKLRKKSPPPVKMCPSCSYKNETQLSSDRDEWPVDKIENACFEIICRRLDVYPSEVSLMSALGGFDRLTADGIKTKYPNGHGIAKEALQKWGSRDKKNNVGALKKIINAKMQTVGVFDEFQEWEGMSVCHGCGIEFN